MSRLSPLQSTSQNNTLFILMGGPGASGWNLLQSAALLIPAQLGLTIILPDHRGTGLSTVLGCDDNDSQTITTGCITYLISKWDIEGLNQFSITAAAHDLSVQIQVYQADHPGRISIYAVSYGTLWLDRFLQIYPTLIPSAIMDGVINPILALNKTDETETKENGPGFLNSKVLYLNIIQSERWLAPNESEIDKETVLAWHRSTLMAPNNSEQTISFRAQWPKYPLDQYYAKVASYSPLLMLSGQLDPATTFPLASQLASITSKTRTFYGIPLAGHVTLNIAKVGFYCPLHLMLAWAFPNNFPSEWNDPQCIRSLPTTLDFVGATPLGQEYSMKFLNISRPFGNDSYDSIPDSNFLFFPHNSSLEDIS
ncbi:unnamed protein product [Rotaria sordida]|uniref:AB hydrolase-1 domain-containing protein n=1 Tax=Rotaria sordida TaxID=392033 RepID=A0A819E3I9_9BILA|nr:unnamed protein product [Rotaria sordida]